MADIYACYFKCVYLTAMAECYQCENVFIFTNTNVKCILPQGSWFPRFCHLWNSCRVGTFCHSASFFPMPLLLEMESGNLSLLLHLALGYIMQRILKICHLLEISCYTSSTKRLIIYCGQSFVLCDLNNLVEVPIWKEGPFFTCIFGLNFLTSTNASS